MNDPSALILVITTTETRDDADALARELVDRNLAACVQTDGPIVSHYRWGGETKEVQEFRLLIKSRQGIWPKLKTKLAELHPYEEPEIVCLAIDDASEGYRNWVIEQTS